MKPAFYCDTEYFFEEWNRWVKTSKTVNRGHWFYYKDYLIAMITSPDITYIWIINRYLVSPVQMQELFSGKKVQGEFHMESDNEYREIFEKIEKNTKSTTSWSSNYTIPSYDNATTFTYY